MGGAVIAAAPGVSIMSNQLSDFTGLTENLLFGEAQKAS
jgi:hypothetical protein